MRFAKASARTGAVLAAVIAVTIGLTTTANAAAPPPASPSSGQTVIVQAAMRLDCVNMTDSARAYAVSHGYCAATGSPGGVSSQAIVTPQGEVTGDCGTSFIEIFPWGWAGEADVNYGFRSTKGGVVGRWLSGYWYNSTNFLSDDWTDAGVQASSTYSGWKTINTGTGWVTATLAGHVILWWGGLCYLLVPGDLAHVS